MHFKHLQARICTVDTWYVVWTFTKPVYTPKQYGQTLITAARICFQVLERAKEGESLEELRARTAAQFTDEQNGFQNPAKLSKKRKDMTIFDEERMKFQRTSD